MELAVNQLFQWCDEEARIERILWIEHAGQRLVMIDVADKKAWPSFLDHRSFEQHIANGDIRLLDSDMYGYLRQPDHAFTPSHIARRDKAWRVIEDIVAAQKEGIGGPDDGAIFNSSILGPQIHAAMERTGHSKQWIRTCLRHYWQKGQMKNALLPQSNRNGTQRKECKSTERQAPKRGRLSKVARYIGVSTDMNIDDTIKEYFRRGTKLFYENAEKVPTTKAFERILALFFHRGKELRNGVFVPLLPPADELPTLSQYRYWYRMRHDLARFVASHKGSYSLDTGERTVLGHLPQTIFGPGYQFEIHVVIGDISLVSRLDRRHILGRPVIYIIVDVFSGLIVGMSVSLEGPSRQGAMLALENMAHDKVTYCREYGVDITEDDWPSHHLPKAILANRSELLLENANILVNTLDIEISDTQPCRLDWKESFERCFPLLDDMTINWVPGSVNSLSKPGRKGYRLDGCLTLNEFRRLVIDCIIEHNMAHRLSDDDLDEDMIADGVEPYPREVWTWGIQNRTGVLRTLPIDDVRRSLLLEAEATVTHEGICFHTMHYTCGSAIQERWFEQVRTEMTGRFTIPVLYDPRTPDQIYLRPLGSQRLEICRLLEKDKATFEGCDWFDIEDMIARRTIRTATDMRDSRHRVELPALRDRIMEEARHETGKAPGDRVAEKGQERETATQDFQGQAAPGAGQPQPVFKGVVERLFALDKDKLFQ